jgi:hypothetical protein
VRVINCTQGILEGFVKEMALLLSLEEECNCSRYWKVVLQVDRAYAEYQGSKLIVQCGDSPCTFRGGERCKEMNKKRQMGSRWWSYNFPLPKRYKQVYVLEFKILRTVSEQLGYRMEYLEIRRPIKGFYSNPIKHWKEQEVGLSHVAMNKKEYSWKVFHG